MLELAPVEIEMKELEILEFTLPVLKIRVLCSKGSYIRALARDFGFALESGAHLAALERTRIGNFSIDNSININDLKYIFYNFSCNLFRYNFV